MKKLLALLLLHPLIHSEEIEFNRPALYREFDGSTFIELVEKIKDIEAKKPIKDKWMKESEYQSLYKDYINEFDSEIYYTIKLGNIEVPCSYRNNSFCYDVEQETIILKASYSWSDSQKRRFNSREVTNDYSGQTAIQKNIGTSTRVSSRINYYDVIILENLDSLSTYDLPFVELPVSINEMKVDEKDYSAYLVFSISLLNDKHYLSGNGTLTYSKEPTIKYPSERKTYERQISANHRGLILKKSDEIILNTTPKEKLKIKRAPNDYVPLFKVMPIYPRKAQQRGTQGYAIVKFTITESGSVENVVPVEGYCGDPRGPQEIMRECSMFNSTSVRAASKLKYKPRIIDGKPVSVDDVIHRFTFTMAYD
jgi:hypothetical protein